MKFNKEKKQAIVSYILEKITNQTEDLSKCVSQTFGINQSTVHNYINELSENNIIKRVKRGEYELCVNTSYYHLKREKGELDSDTYVYNSIFKEYIKDFPQNVQIIWDYALSEMMNNVIDHSGADEVLLVIEQDYLKTSVSIIDDGVGIFEKIKNHFNFETLDDAICELFKGKLTTDSSKHSGEGIFFTSKIADNFMIISSKKVFAVNKFDESILVDSLNKVEAGTGVFISLSNYTHKMINEIFDAYSNVDGGFSKTKIPLKNIFDSAPVSRSQARRVCNRLEKFKEVILDFDNLQWMGQGFAHQVFVVFKNEHPDIKIVPINMNKEVEKMYNHVVAQ